MVIKQLGEEKTTAIAEIGIIVAELVAVIAQGQWDRLIVWQRLEAAEMANPFGIAQTIQTDRLRRPRVAVAQDRLREIGGGYGIVQGELALFQPGRGAIGHQLQVFTFCHEANW